MAVNDRTEILMEMKQFRARMDDLPTELQIPEPNSPRGRILRGACEVLGTLGIEGLTTRVVAEAAGVNPAMIHYYFGTKEKLLDIVIRGVILDTLRNALDAMLSNDDPEGVLPRHPVTIYGILRRDPLRLRLMRQVLSSEPKRLENAALGLGEYGIHGVKRVIGGLIGELQDNGTVPRVPPDHLLLFLMSLVYGLVLFEPVAESFFGIDLADDRQWAEISKSFVKILEAGLSGPARREG